MQAGTNFHLYARRQMQKTCASQKYKRKLESKVLRRKRKLQDLKQGASKKANFHYGSNLDDTPDVSPETLDRLCKEYLQKHVKKNEEQIKLIEKQSVQQADSVIWKKERVKRLTSSNFGMIWV